MPRLEQIWTYLESHIHYIIYVYWSNVPWVLMPQPVKAIFQKLLLKPQSGSSPATICFGFPLHGPVPLLIQAGWNEIWLAGVFVVRPWPVPTAKIPRLLIWLVLSISLRTPRPLTIPLPYSSVVLPQISRCWWLLKPVFICYCGRKGSENDYLIYSGGEVIGRRMSCTDISFLSCPGQSGKLFGLIPVSCKLCNACRQGVRYKVP